MLAPDQNNMRRGINGLLTDSFRADAYIRLCQGLDPAALACPIRLPVWPSVCVK